LIGVYEYFDNLYHHHYKNNEISVREKIEKVNDLISKHEEEIANPLLAYIESRDDIRLIGKNKITNKNRAPTIAFTFNQKSSKYISSELVKNGIATRNDNFYAWRCLKALGIDTEDGVVRTSMVHYNTREDINKLINALKTLTF
jgi:selenocysteine lyase/cysteine desulfurase